MKTFRFNQDFLSDEDADALDSPNLGIPGKILSNSNFERPFEAFLAKLRRVSQLLPLDN